MKDFKKLEIWQLGMEIADQVYDLFDDVPWQKAGKLRDQATDAAVSIPSNIAEGNSRRSEKEKYRFHEYALGSAFELQTQILVVHRRKWLPEERLIKTSWGYRTRTEDGRSVPGHPGGLIKQS